MAAVRAPHPAPTSPSPGLALVGPVLPFQSAELQEQSQGNEESCELTCLWPIHRKKVVLLRQLLPSPAIAVEHIPTGFSGAGRLALPAPLGGDTVNSFSGDISPLAVQRPALRDR